MELNHSPIVTLNNLLDYDINQFYLAEVQLSHHLPVLIERAGSLTFKTIMQKYLEYVRQHVQKFEVFLAEGRAGLPEPGNRIMEAYLDEAEDRLVQCSDPEVKDACLLASLQAINHYKISAYGTAAAFANALGMHNKAHIFHEAEVNEKQIDERLTQLAEQEINLRAKAPFLLHQ